MQARAQDCKRGSQFVRNRSRGGLALSLQALQGIRHAIEMADHFCHFTGLPPGLGADGEIAACNTLRGRGQRAERQGHAARNPKAGNQPDRQADHEADEQGPFLTEQQIALPVLPVNFIRTRAVLTIALHQFVQLMAYRYGQAALKVSVLRIGEQKHAARQDADHHQQHGGCDADAEAHPDAVYEAGHSR